MFPLKIIVQFSEFCSSHDEITFFAIFKNIWQCDAWPNKKRKANASSFRGTFCIVLCFQQILYCNIYREESDNRKRLKETVIEPITEVGDYDMSNKDSVKQAHQKMLNENKDINFNKLIVDFDKELQNYIQLFEKLLSFIRASREQNWELPLYSLRLLCPYFFAFDMTNYARMTPVYLSQMHELKKKNKTTWALFAQGLFSVSKSDLPFSAIGSDHGIGQKNRALKVLGGIKGIAILKDFCE